LQRLSREFGAARLEAACARALSVHYRTLPPRHRHPPPEDGKCYPCVWYDLLPRCRAAQPCRQRRSHAGRATCSDMSP
jgi:hypothetical protein